MKGLSALALIPLLLLSSAFMGISAIVVLPTVRTPALDNYQCGPEKLSKCQQDVWFYWLKIHAHGDKCWPSGFAIHEDESSNGHLVFINYNPVPLWNIHIDCSTFIEYVHPNRRIIYEFEFGRCVVNNGRPIGSLQTIAIDLDFQRGCKSFISCTWAGFHGWTYNYPRIDYKVSAKC